MGKNPVMVFDPTWSHLQPVRPPWGYFYHHHHPVPPGFHPHMLAPHIQHHHQVAAAMRVPLAQRRVRKSDAVAAKNKTSIMRRIRALFLTAGLESNNQQSAGSSTNSSSRSPKRLGSAPGFRSRSRIQERPLPPGPPGKNSAPVKPPSVMPMYDRLIFDSSEESDGTDRDEGNSENREENDEERDDGVGDDEREDSWKSWRSFTHRRKPEDTVYGLRSNGKQLSDDQAYSSIDDDSSGYHHYCPIFSSDEDEAPRKWSQVETSGRKPRGILVPEADEQQVGRWWKTTRLYSLDIRGHENLRQDTEEFFANSRTRMRRRDTLDVVVPKDSVFGPQLGNAHCSCCPHNRATDDGFWRCPEDQDYWDRSWPPKAAKRGPEHWESRNVKERTRRILDMIERGPLSMNCELKTDMLLSPDHSIEKPIPIFNARKPVYFDRCSRNRYRLLSSLWSTGPRTPEEVTVVDDRKASRDLEEEDPIGAGIKEEDSKIIHGNCPKGFGSSQNSDSGWESSGSGYNRAASNEAAMGISKQGNLSIDYSCSWRNLDQHWSLFR